MLTSELITKLQDLIDKHGDLPFWCICDHCECEFDAEPVWFSKDNPDVSCEEDCEPAIVLC